MPTPEDFNPENSRICWPAILAVFAVQMIVLITLSWRWPIILIFQLRHRMPLKQVLMLMINPT